MPGEPAAKPILDHRPATFRARGVAVPFTTPTLLGARVRRADAGALEFIFPAGPDARGMHVLDWTELGSVCRPTLHDRGLQARLDDLDDLTPGSVREAAWAHAAAGLAGPVAAKAAAEAITAQSAAAARLRAQLMIEMADHLDRDGSAASATSREARVLEAVGRLAARIDCPAELVAQALAGVAAAFVPLGAAAHPTRTNAPASVPAEIAALQAVRQEIRLWLDEAPGRGDAAGELVAATAHLMLVCARATLSDARLLLRDLPALLQRWLTHRAAIEDIVGRPRWLLDGWDRIRLLWRDGAGLRPGGMAELADLVPAMPPEVRGWVVVAEEGAAGALRPRRPSPQAATWRTPPPPSDLIARQEELVAACAVAPAGIDVLGSPLRALAGG